MRIGLSDCCGTIVRFVEKASGQLIFTVPIATFGIVSFFPIVQAQDTDLKFVLLKNPEPAALKPLDHAFGLSFQSWQKQEK